MTIEMCHLLFIYVGVDFKKVLDNALRSETDVALNILCSADFACVDRHAIQKV